MKTVSPPQKGDRPFAAAENFMRDTDIESRDIFHRFNGRSLPNRFARNADTDTARKRYKSATDAVVKGIQ